MTIGNYWQLAKISWSNGLVYRLNFVMWRVRLVVQLLAVYFLWVAVLKNNQVAFGYSQGQLLTYILATSIIRSLVFSSRSVDAQAEIASGDLNNYLVKPINYFGYWLTRDGADKLLNLVFSLVEVAGLIILLKPPLAGPTNLVNLAVGLGVTLVAMLMYFYFSFLISLTTFWMPEQNGWPQRFFMFTILEFFGGGMFPLDILPASWFGVVKLLPTSYFLYVPAQVFLGRLGGKLLAEELAIMAVWLVILHQLCGAVFRRGLRVYGAYGR